PGAGKSRLPPRPAGRRARRLLRQGAAQEEAQEARRAALPDQGGDQVFRRRVEGGIPMSAMYNFLFDRKSLTLLPCGLVVGGGLLFFSGVLVGVYWSLPYGTEIQATAPIPPTSRPVPRPIPARPPSAAPPPAAVPEPAAAPVPAAPAVPERKIEL